MEKELVEGLKVVLPRLGLIAFGVIALWRRKEWGRVVAENLKKKDVPSGVRSIIQKNIVVPAIFSEVFSLSLSDWYLFYR